MSEKQIFFYIPSKTKHRHTKERCTLKFHQTMVAIWPFWKGLSEIKWNHLAIWPFGCFLPFWMLKKIVYFNACLVKSEQNLQYCFKFLLWILLFKQIFEENLAFIWPVLKLLMAKFGLFKIFGPGSLASNRSRSN